MIKLILKIQKNIFRQFINIVQILNMSIFIDNQSLDEFEKLLISCHYIKGMDVHLQTINDFYNNHQLLDNRFLYLLVKFAPVSLFEIQINLRQLNNKSLNLFFNNWRNRKP